MSAVPHYSMRGITTYPSVTDELLATVVSRILSAGTPLKIVLFGSHARGDAGPDSDLDLLIVEESAIPRHRRSPKYLRALTGIFPAKDIVVWTPEEISEWAGIANHFVTTINRDGRVLFAR